MKCSGEKPCRRCADLGRECFYRPQLRRGPRPRPRPGEFATEPAKRANIMPAPVAAAASPAPASSAPASSAPASATTGPPAFAAASPASDEAASGPLDPPMFLRHAERRIWRLFFASYRHCREQKLDLCWHHLLIERLQAHLSRQRSRAAVVLTDWFERAGILEHLRTSTDGMAYTCTRSPEVCPYCASRAVGDALSSSAADSAGDVSLGGAAGDLDLPETGPLVEVNMVGRQRHFAFASFAVNDDFTAEFGLRTDEMNALTDWTGGAGMLPWGMDVLAPIFNDDTEFLRFLQVTARKFHDLGCALREALPLTRYVRFAISDLVVRRKSGATARPTRRRCRLRACAFAAAASPAVTRFRRRREQPRRCRCI